MSVGGLIQSECSRDFDFERTGVDKAVDCQGWRVIFAVVALEFRSPVLSAVRPLSPCSARLSGLRTQRLAGPEDICVHVRSHRRNDESLHGSARAIAPQPLYAGLRRHCRVSNGRGTSGSDRGSHDSGRRFAQRRSGAGGRRATSGTIPTWSAMTRISGPMNLLF